MPYYALINEGTEFEEATIGLATPEAMEEFVDKNVESGHYEPLEDDLLTVTIVDMKIDPKTLGRKVVRAYMWGFKEGYDPLKVEQTVDERCWMLRCRRLTANCQSTLTPDQRNRRGKQLKLCCLVGYIS